MTAERVFVGRQAELDRWEAVLASPGGQAVVVVGQAGMGKTMLVNRMAESATNHPELKCGFVRYEVTPTDSPATTMALMIDDAFEAADVVERSMEKTERRRKQWFALIKLLPKGGELVQSLRRDSQRNTRDQFVERLRLISEGLPDNGRAVFVIDSDKYMAPGSQDDWRLVVRELPDKVKFVFAQRPEDALISSPDFMALPNVQRIPDERLAVLSDQEVEDLVTARSVDIKVPERDLREAVRRYQNHPYALSAALDLIAEGFAPEDLPPDPTPERFTETQWDRVCGRHGVDAIRLFEAYAVLEVPVPDEVVEPVSGLRPAARKALLANPYLAGLLRTEQHSRRIYHRLLADNILGQLSRDDARVYHRRAVLLYRLRLDAQERPDALSAVRLPEHVLALEGGTAFVACLIDECMAPLISLGLLDAALSLSHRALHNFVSAGTEQEAVIRSSLGLIHETRGDLDQAEGMHRKALEIDEKLGRLEGMANQYGNLGLVYRKRGELDHAEAMHRKSLEIGEKLGWLEGMASQYAGLGLIYRTRGDLDQAEEVHRKALAINEKLGRLEGLGVAYGNLGAVSEARGDPETAREYWTKAREVFAQIGMTHMVARLQKWLDGGTNGPA